jgi:hypothetical protein
MTKDGGVPSLRDGGTQVSAPACFIGFKKRFTPATLPICHPSTLYLFTFLLLFSQKKPDPFQNLQ